MNKNKDLSLPEQRTKNLHKNKIRSACPTQRVSPQKIVHAPLQTYRAKIYANNSMNYAI